MRTSNGQRAWRPVVGVWLLFAGLYALTGGGRFHSVDEVGAFQTARYWWDGVPIAPSSVTVAGVGGRRWGMHGPMLPGLALPLYAAGDLAEEVLPGPWLSALAGEPYEDELGVQWGGDPHIFTVSFLNALVTATLMAVYLVLVRRLGHSTAVALLSTFIAGLTTLLFTHSKNFFTHSLVALLLLAALAAALSARRGRGVRRLLLAGAAAGAMILTRPSSAVAVPWLLGYVFWARAGVAGKPTLRPPVRLLVLAIPLSLAALGVLAFNHYRFGDPLELGYLQTGSFALRPLEGVATHLFSLDRSIFIYSPALLPAVVAWGRFRRRHRSEAFFVAGVSVSYLALYSFWGGPVGGWIFGNRFLLPIVPLLLLALPTAVERLGAGRNRRIAIPLTALLLLGGLAVQIVGLTPNVAFARHAYVMTGEASTQIGAHLAALAERRFIDDWAARLASEVGWGATLALAAPALLAMCVGLALALRHRGAQPGDLPVDAPDPAPQVVERLPRSAGPARSRLRSVLTGAGLFYLAIVALGAVQFAGRRPEVITPEVTGGPIEPAPNGVSTNLADLHRGARVRASSYDRFRQNHPLYAIDGEARPTPNEVWASDPDDRAPFIEVVLPREATVRGVRPAFLAAGGSGAWVPSDYDILCVRTQRRRQLEVSRLAVRDNTDTAPRHLLACPSTDRVRLEFHPRGGVPQRVRMAELTILGSVR